MNKRKSLYGATTPAMPDLPLNRVAALQSAAQATVQQLPSDAIDPNPFQARMSFDNLDDLANAIRAQGFTSRLRVRPHPEQSGRFQLVYGERRLRAATIAGLTVIPCEIVPHTDAEMIEIGLVENIQREELRPIEEARALRRFLDERGYSIRELAERIGKTKGYVQTRIDLLRMPDDVQQMVEEHPHTFTTGLLIGQLPTATERQPLIEAMIRGETTKDAIRALVQQLQAARQAPRPAAVSGSDSGTPTAHDTEPSAQVALTATHAAGAPGSTPQTVAEASGAENRKARQSDRALRQAKQSFQAMLRQAQGFASDLLPADRSELLAFVVDKHFPELERFVEELRNPE